MSSRRVRFSADEDAAPRGDVPVGNDDEDVPPPPPPDDDDPIDWSKAFLPGAEEDPAEPIVHRESQPPLRESVSSNYSESSARTSSRSISTSTSVSSAFLGKDWELRTVDDALEAIRFGKFQWRLFLLCGAANFTMAVETSVTTVLFPALKEQWDLHNADLAALGGSTALGVLLGSVVLGRVGDRIGRRPIFQLSVVLAALFGLFSAFAPTVHWFIAWRFFLGIGFGAQMIVDVVLLCEYLPSRNRGMYLMLLGTCFGIGTLFGVILAWYVVPSMGWHWMVGFASAPAVALLFFRAFIYETPRFLLIRHRNDYALAILRDMAHKNHVDHSLEQRVGDMHLAHEEIEEADAIVQTGFSKVFGELLRPTTIILMVIWGLTACGSSVFYWLPVYLTENRVLGAARSHILLQNEYRAAILIAVGDICGGLVFAAVVDMFDRRNVLRFSLFSLTGASLALSFFEDHPAVLLSTLPFISALRSAALSLLYTYTSELYPTSGRMTGVGVCSAMYRIPTVGAHWVSLTLLHQSYQHVVLVFASIYLLAGVATFLLPYDTRNVPLADYYYQEVRWIKEQRDDPHKTAEHAMEI